MCGRRGRREADFRGFSAAVEEVEEVEEVNPGSGYLSARTGGEQGDRVNSSRARGRCRWIGWLLLCFSLDLSPGFSNRNVSGVLFC